MHLKEKGGDRAALNGLVHAFPCQNVEILHLAGMGGPGQAPGAGLPCILAPAPKCLLPRGLALEVRKVSIVILKGFESSCIALSAACRYQQGPIDVENLGKKAQEKATGQPQVSSKISVSSYMCIHSHENISYK